MRERQIIGERWRKFLLKILFIDLRLALPYCTIAQSLHILLKNVLHRKMFIPFHSDSKEKKNLMKNAFDGKSRKKTSKSLEDKFGCSFDEDLF